MSNWTDRIKTKPVQGPDEPFVPTMKPARLDLVGPDPKAQRETLKHLVEKGVVTPNEARKHWNNQRWLARDSKIAGRRLAREWSGVLGVDRWEMFRYKRTGYRHE